MKNPKQTDISITGLGVTSSIGRGKEAFLSALLEGQHNFSYMQRPGRCLPGDNAQDPDLERMFIGAEIPKIEHFPKKISKRILRTASYSAQIGMLTLAEAWDEAKLDDVDPERIGLVVGGSNFQQRELTLLHDQYKDRLDFLRPNYSMTYMDSDLCGLCTEIFGIKGLAYTIGGASASGQLAVIQAAQALRSGAVDICIAMGTLMDLSYWECQGFRLMGAMGSTQYANNPELAARPFDQHRDGFIYGEACGVLVLERSEDIRPDVSPYARIVGEAVAMDGNRNPNPSIDGEIRVIKKALAMANKSAKDIEYVNPHGTGSSIGDEIELAAIDHMGLRHAFINSTKSITGHGLSAAGAVELITCALQMKEGCLHPLRNLDSPMDHSYNWVGSQAKATRFENCLNMSMGFGGINTAVCLQKN